MVTGLGLRIHPESRLYNVYDTYLRSFQQNKLTRRKYIKPAIEQSRYIYTHTHTYIYIYIYTRIYIYIYIFTYIYVYVYVYIYIDK